ncbi:OB-fold nucleic acid binding domain-containing protein [archaeon]|nr:OB-fold nucleic acid binding domain-containing protein [archaeon]
MPPQRQTAYNVWISDLNNNNFIKSTKELEPSYVEFEDKKVTRVNLIGTVINKYENESHTYISLIIDDNSSQISIKVWNENLTLLSEIQIGDIILVIGKVKRAEQINPELYISPEIVRKVNPNVELMGKIKLINESGKPKEKIIEEKEDEIKIEEIKMSSSGNLRQEILNLIEKNNETGLTLNELKNKIKNASLEIEIQELLKEGEIYEIKEKYHLLR